MGKVLPNVEQREKGASYWNIISRQNTGRNGVELQTTSANEGSKVCLLNNNNKNVWKGPFHRRRGGRKVLKPSLLLSTLLPLFPLLDTEMGCEMGIGGKTARRKDCGGEALAKQQALPLMPRLLKMPPLLTLTVFSKDGLADHGC